MKSAAVVGGCWETSLAITKLYFLDHSCHMPPVCQVLEADTQTHFHPALLSLCPTGWQPGNRMAQNPWPAAGCCWEALTGGGKAKGTEEPFSSWLRVQQGISGNWRLKHYHCGGGGFDHQGCGLLGSWWQRRVVSPMAGESAATNLQPHQHRCTG